MKPADMLRYTTNMAAALEAAQKKAVFVGLPKDKVGDKVYGDGMTVINVGAIHEFGVPAKGMPERSFLRVPFATKRRELNASIAKQFQLMITKGLDPDVALGRVGVLATNVSKGAFTSLGYGAWTPITEETKQRKGSSQTLIDTGILRGSITWSVRDAS